MRFFCSFRIVLLLTALSGATDWAQARRLSPAPAPVIRRAPAEQMQGSQPRAGMSQSGRPEFGGAQVSAQPAQRPLAQIERRTNPGAPVKGEHLPAWIAQHSNLNPAQQQQALEQEPGFHDLPQATQQRMRERLVQLSTMPPQQREKLIQRNETLEKLTPEQRSQVRGATQQWGSLPPDERKAVGRAFRQIRLLPSDQRAAALSSGRYSGQFNEEQRASLTNLMRVEPMLPPPDSGKP